MQTTVYNIGIAAGSLAGGLILQRADAGALPWTASALSAAALAAVAAARRQAFPADRAGAGTRAAGPARKTTGRSEKKAFPGTGRGACLPPGPAVQD